MERLESTETALQQQTTLFTHAQENWAVTEGQLRNVRAKHSAELDSLRGELVPQINQLRASAAAVANQMRVVQADNEDLQRRLSTTSSELEKMVAERNRLAERNADLQRELVTTRNLVETMARNQHQSLAADRSLHSRNGDASVSAVAARHSPHSHINDSVEEWVEAARIESARKQRYANGVYTESVVPSSRYPPQHSDSSECLSSSSPDRRASAPNGRKCKSSMRKSVRSSKNRHSYHLCEELARLTNRTAMLESVALALTQQREQLAAQQKTEQMNGQRSSVPVASSTLCSTQQKPIPHSMSGGVCPTALSESGPNPASAPVGYPDSHNSTSKHELDTDADSSAFTDLSKVSPVSRNDHVGIVASTLPHSSPVSANLSRLSSTQEPYKSDPGQSTRIPRTRVESDVLRFPANGSDGLQSNGLQDSRTSPRKTAQDQKDSDLLDPDRINELHRRNRLQPLHLRTSYPVETQCVEPEQVAGALSHLASTGQSKGPFPLSKPKQTFRKPSATKVLGTVPEDHRTVLREVDEDNLLEATHRNSVPGSSQPPNRLKLQETVASSKVDSPIAAGYQPIPRNIQAITDALIAASYDPSAMAEALSAEISKASLTARNSSRSGDTSQSTVRTHSAKPSMHLETSDLNGVSRRVIQATDLTRHTSSPSKQSHFIDENTNPPILSLPVTGNMTSPADRFVRPSAPSRARGHQHNSGGDSEDSLSVASSIRSNKSSIAFEIPNEQATVKVRRLPASRRPPSSTTARRGVEGKRKPQPPIALNCAKLPLGPPVSGDDNSYPVVETPIQRNTRYLNETSGVCR
ncbi:RAB6-interacting protein 2 [Clonorchis sinensis]|uniref:RAB6-interacting protein 2 n=1 Tax=Clonorchis sinensis TaxID=79923 RepID=G7YVJ9_CLOSI|nr:RAB6-interacting protein 2 [Clonorchis sinensis]